MANPNEEVELEGTGETDTCDDEVTCSGRTAVVGYMYELTQPTCALLKRARAEHTVKPDRLRYIRSIEQRCRHGISLIRCNGYMVMHCHRCHTLRVVQQHVRHARACRAVL